MNKFGTRSRLGSAFIIGALSTGMVFAQAACAAAYSILDLGTLGGSTSTAFGFNGSGQVVGESFTVNDNNTHAFRTAPGAPIGLTSDLGTLGGSVSYGFAVNSSGQAVGWSALALNDGTYHAFRTSSNAPMTPANDLGTLGGTLSRASGINASAQVVGSSDTTSGVSHAFRTTPNGVITPESDLGTLGGLSSYANGINASGQVVGQADLAAAPGVATPASMITIGLPPVIQHAFRTASNGVITPAGDLGTLGGSTSDGVAINDIGQVVGEANLPGDTVHHAFRTTANGPITLTSDLGTLGGPNSHAFSINSLGQTVGYSDTGGGGFMSLRAFLVDTTGAMQDLNALIPTSTGWVLTVARGINDAGQIVGSGTINGQNHAFLLTPTPEPTTLCLFATGALALLARGRRSET